MSSKPETLDEIEQRALRHLDGITVNRDAMARDVLTLVRAVRNAKLAISNLRKTQEPNSIFAQSFDNIFKDLDK